MTLSPSFSYKNALLLLFDLLLCVGLCVPKQADNESVFPYTVETQTVHTSFTSKESDSLLV